MSIKKGMLLVIGIVILLLTFLCDLALSTTQDGHWTNYIHMWNMRLPKQKKISLHKEEQLILRGTTITMAQGF